MKQPRYKITSTSRNLLLYGKLKTTPSRARIVRSFTEKIITVARRDLVNNPDKLSLTATRFIIKKLKMTADSERKNLLDLIHKIAKNNTLRPGGYISSKHFPSSNGREIVSICILGYNTES